MHVGFVNKSRIKILIYPVLASRVCISPIDVPLPSCSLLITLCWDFTGMNTSLFYRLCDINNYDVTGINTSFLPAV